MADEIATKPKQQRVGVTPQSHTKLAAWAVVAIVVLAIIGGGLYWYNKIYKPNQYYKTAISAADSAYNNGNSLAYIEAAQALREKIRNFRTDNQKEIGYRKLALLYDGEGDSQNALATYLRAETIHQTNDLTQVVRIATLAMLTGDNATAITYYRRAQTVYNANPTAYQKNFPQGYVDSWGKIADELQKEGG